MDDIGLEIWESSRVLCQYVLQSNSLRRFITSVSSILELGAGMTSCAPIGFQFPACVFHACWLLPTSCRVIFTSAQAMALCIMMIACC